MSPTINPALYSIVSYTLPFARLTVTVTFSTVKSFTIRVTNHYIALCVQWVNPVSQIAYSLLKVR